MKAEQSLRQSIRMALAAAVCLPALWVGNASAQEEEEAAALERVEVTGSRIRRAAIEGAKPVLSIAREDLDRSGVQSVGDFLQRLTMSGSALNTKFNSSGNFGFPPDGGGVGAGSTQVDLRHLDAKRALVLVDGRRWVNETSASGVGGGVDLNTIPLAIVERIEVLTDGASSIYGSDAIAGVVNIITRKDFDGVAASAYGGGYVEDGDGQTEAYDFSMGKAESSGSLFFNLSYTDQEEVSSADREISRFPIPYTGVRFGSSATPQGRFIFFDPNNDTHGGLCPQIDTDGDSVPDSAFCNITTPDGAGFPGDVPNFPNDFIPFSNALRFNFAPFNLLVTPSERTSAFLQGRHDLTDTATFYAKFLFNNRRSVNRAAPEPIFIGPEAGNGNRLDTIVIDATNPYNPFGFDLDPANGFLLLGRRPLEGGPRIFTQDVDTYYFGAGFEGVLDLGARGFEWDVNYIFSRSEAIQTTQNTYSNRNIALALGPLADCQADPECVPLNLFGGQGADGSGTITQEMLDYIRVTLHDASGQELRSYTANLSGDIADLPAGPLGVAVGYEYRDHDGFYQPDQLSSSGDANGVPSQPTRGGFTVDEFYAEFVVPVLADMPAAELFEFEAAVRSSDYSTFGSTTNSKFGFRWKPGDNWVLRGTLAEGFRAPNIGELFGGISRFDATIEDPCSSDFIAALPPALGTELRNNCTSLGVPTTFFQTNPQIAIQTGGNPDLKPETADSLTLGVVYSAGWAEGTSWSDSLEFELTYYKHEIDEAIGPVDAQTQLNGCAGLVDVDGDGVVDDVGPVNAELCNGITRAPSGGISSFRNTLVNLGGIDTDGWDFNVTWKSPSYSLGRFSVMWSNSFVNEFVQTDITGSTELAGLEQNDSAIPEWTSNVNATWTRGDWSAAWTVRYIDAVIEACDPAVDALGRCSNSDPVAPTNTLGATVYNDAQVSYFWKVFDTDTRLTVGVNNLFDRDPPDCTSCSLNGYDASTYDIPGRFMYFRIDSRF